MAEDMKYLTDKGWTQNMILDKLTSNEEYEPIVKDIMAKFYSERIGPGKTSPDRLDMPLEDVGDLVKYLKFSRQLDKMPLDKHWSAIDSLASKQRSERYNQDEIMAIWGGDPSGLETGSSEEKFYGEGVSEEVPPSQEGYSDETGTYDEYGNVIDYYKGMSPTQNVAEPSGERSNELLQEYLNKMKLEQLMKDIQESQTPQGEINQEIRKSDAELNSVN